MRPELAAATAHGPAAPSLSRARRSAFYVALTAALLLLAVPMAPFLVIPLAWPFLAEQLGVHHVHDIGVATLLWLMVVGLLARPARPSARSARCSSSSSSPSPWSA